MRPFIHLLTSFEYPVLDAWGEEGTETEIDLSPCLTSPTALRTQAPPLKLYLPSAAPRTALPLFWNNPLLLSLLADPFYPSDFGSGVPSLGEPSPTSRTRLEAQLL